ncbi:hypothetical protein Pan44_17300 [Caulifigura coniformis]|uniref:Uncharacterized protein n=1 Tax=Caulifigura coniformis TaxID=2527983 RepID=A0A517SC36_9PLAN|nr:hypothetical protein [Caulifigura coniformis]QDT53707.1 hypothetical protein Pan44_17300 [Caulifigura coniformis]
MVWFLIVLLWLGIGITAWCVCPRSDKQGEGESDGGIWDPSSWFDVF